MINGGAIGGNEALSQVLVAAEWALEMQKSLAHYILNGIGVNEIVSELSKKAGCCAVLEDTAFSVLAAESGDPVEYDLLKPYFSLKTGSTPDNPNLKNSLNIPVLMSEQYNGITVCRLVISVNAGTEPLGYLSLIKAGEGFTEREAALLKYAAGGAAVLLALSKKNAETELRLKGSFIDDLVSGNYLDMESIKIRARALEYDITTPHRVLVAQFDESRQFFGFDKSEQSAFKNELVRRVHNLISLKEQSMAAYKNNEMIILVRNDMTKRSFEKTRRLCEEIIRDIAPMLKTKMYIGIGKACSKLEDYRQSYLSAKKALEIGSYMITEGQVFALEQFKMHTLFLSTLKPEELYAYANEQLGSLIEYDRKHQSELIKTLQEFLYLRNNIEATARSLNMSVSGLKYRLKKIEKIIGYDLKDHKICFDLQLALIVLQMFGEYRL